jgi:hypothetical protein
VSALGLVTAAVHLETHDLAHEFRGLMTSRGGHRSGVVVCG